MERLDCISRKIEGPHSTEFVFQSQLEVFLKFGLIKVGCLTQRQNLTRSTQNVIKFGSCEARRLTRV